MKFTVLTLSVLCFISLSVSGQKLKELNPKPTPQYQDPSFCAPEGSAHTDKERKLNLSKNRIDESKKNPKVGFDEIMALGTVGKPKATIGNVPEAKDESILRFEGTPIRLDGFLKVVPNKAKQPPIAQGGIAEGKESCNCGSEKPDEIDFHIWLVKASGDGFEKAIVVEMAPRVRVKHKMWTIKELTEIARQKYPVRVYGWLFYDSMHKAQLPDPDFPDRNVRRGTLWEIHPIMKVQYLKAGIWTML